MTSAKIATSTSARMIASPTTASRLAVKRRHVM
jgi:hypothetical protein